MSDQKGSWWSNKSFNFRLWAFISAIWPIMVLLFILVFDPFNNGRWKYMDSDEYTQMYFIMFLPILAGFIKWLYNKFVALKT